MSDLRVTNLKGRNPGEAPTLPDGVVITGITTVSSVIVGTGITLSSSGINVSGVITATSIVVSAGTTALPSISPTGDSNTGIFFPSADTIAVSAGGTERLRVDSSGRLGVGTSPSKELHVYKPSGTTTFWLENGGTQKGIAAINIDDSTYTFQSTYNTGGTAARPFAWYNVSTELMSLDTSGRLLVGVTTANANVNGGILQLKSGITFPATAVAATDVNTLDDYEEGTWTPSVGGTATYSSQNGTYTKIGRTVTINFSLNITLLGTGSNYAISGLPFNVGLAGYGATGYFAGLAINVIGLTCNVTGTTVLFNSMNASGSTATNNPVILGNSCLIQGSVTYFV